MLISPVLLTRLLPRRWLLKVGLWLWQWVHRPWLAILAGLIGIMLALAVWQLPQLPGQLVDEHAAAATWLLNTSTAYGIWGNPFLALGLFDVLRSPLLYLLLALLFPTLAAQMAVQVGALLLQRAVNAYTLTTPSPTSGKAIPLPSERDLYRWRGIVKAAPAILTSLLANTSASAFATIKRADAPILSQSPHLPHNEVDDDLPKSEARILGMRNHRLQYVRPLLMLGLLIAVVGAWGALAFGWQVASPPLAPGAIFRSANRNLMVHYEVDTTDSPKTSLKVRLQGENLVLPTNQPAQQRVGLANIQTRPAYPAIWLITSDSSDRLTLPGESTLRSTIGMVFPNPGSEESILMPEERAGLRIVQRSGSAGFVLELYRSDAVQPVYRAELTEGGQLTIPLELGQPELIIYMLPGLQVDVRQLPGIWLVLAGLLFALVGAIAFLRPSNFVLIQIAPWSPEYTVITLQSDQPNLIAELLGVFATLPNQSSHDANQNDESPPPTLPQTIA